MLDFSHDEPRPRPLTAPPVAGARARTATRTHGFTESVIREMTRLCQQHGGVNLAQGFPDFPAPERDQGRGRPRRSRRDVNQYAITWGAKRLRDALVEKTRRFYGLAFDPETEITVCCGSTECMVATLLALVNPGEEVIVFEPFYENYGPDAILCGATPRFVRLREPDWSFDPDELAQRSTTARKAIVINTPEQSDRQGVHRAPSWSRSRRCASSWDVVASPTRSTSTSSTTAREHVPLASLAGHARAHGDDQRDFEDLQRDRLAHRLVPRAAGDSRGAIRKVHDFLTVGAPGPAAGSGGRGVDLAGRLLPAAGRRLSRAARLPGAGAREARVSGRSSRAARIT